MSSAGKTAHAISIDRRGVGNGRSARRSLAWGAVNDVSVGDGRVAVRSTALMMKNCANAHEATATQKSASRKAGDIID
jgi:hypothetical protein